MPPSVSRISVKLAHLSRYWLFQRPPSSSSIIFKPRLQQFRWNSSSSSEQPPTLRGVKPPAGRETAQQDGSETPSAVQQPLSPPTRVSDGSAFLVGARPLLLGAAFTTTIGLAVVFVGGILYLDWYKARVIRKIEIAFEPGYDPALHIADHCIKTQSGATTSTAGADWASDVRRQEQDIIDEIVHGMRHGNYILLMGSKGVGKRTMILDAMRRVDADGVAICEAHEDPEVFRLRLGKGDLVLTSNEASATLQLPVALTYIDLPRSSALNKLEKVALKMVPKRKKPLVLVINDCQQFNDDEESHRLLQQIQEKAEIWAEGHLVTVVFSSDDFWPYPLLRKIENRLHVISVKDLRGQESLAALRHLRQQHFGKVEDDSVLSEVLKTSGGRLSRLNVLSREKNVLEATEHMLRDEKGWLLSVIGLIPHCDGDVIDEQKVCASSWSLLREFAKKYREREEGLKAAAKPGEVIPEPDLPAISYYEARQIMARADFLGMLDHLNIINIDTDHMVRPDSMVVLRAAIEIVEEPGFDELLDAVKERIDAIESLHRTRELTWKASDNEDTVRIMLQPYEKREKDKENDKEKAGRRSWWPFT